MVRLPRGLRLNKVREVFYRANFFSKRKIFYARDFQGLHHGLVSEDLESPLVSRLRELEEVCFDHPWSARQIQEELNRPGSIHIFLDAHGNVQEFSSPDSGPSAGFCLIRLPGPGDSEPAEIMRIAVRPDARRRGLARRLLELAEKSVREYAPNPRILLEVSELNEPARALYEKAGWREIHRRRKYYRDGADALILEKRD